MANASNGDMIKSQTQFMTHYEDFGWFGTLSELHPGTGYALKVSLAGVWLWTPSDNS